MLKSMTGYGKALLEFSNYAIEIEIKSINHKYCIVKAKLPMNLQSLEHKIISQIKSKFSRGSIDVFITVDSIQDAKSNFVMNISKLSQLIDELEKVRMRFQIGNAISTETLALFKDVYIDKIEEDYDLDKLWEGISQCLSKACNELLGMREKEGSNLQRDIVSRLEKLKELLLIVEEKSKNLASNIRTLFEQKVEALIGRFKLELERINQEIVLLAEKSDITEEITRLKSHIGQSFTIIKGEDAPGRKLEFMMQELLRETNTITAKIANAEIAQIVVIMKVEIEKIREQLLNIE